jgi:hypothetical protein
MSTNKRRMEEIACLRYEGAQARLNERPLSSNPYGVVNGAQWSKGWYDKDEELRRQAEEATPTFSEALEAYLRARDERKQAQFLGDNARMDRARRFMEDAARQLDALVPKT